MTYLASLLASLLGYLANILQATSNWFKRKAGEELDTLPELAALIEEAEEVIDDIPELGAPERVTYFVTIRDEAAVNVKEARTAHQAARANR